MSSKDIKRRYGRSNPVRDYRKAVLIVCEGAETEPFYFKALFEYLELQKFHIQIEKGKHGLTPIGVVEKAISKDEERTVLSRKVPSMIEFDSIWCVFDKDQHMSIDEAQAEIDRCNKEEQNCSDIPDEFEPRFSSAFSDPCFEYWLLLHFVETAGHFETCKKVIKELKKYLRYTKRTFDINKVLPETNKAAARARKLRKSGVTNPSTTLDLLVASLKKLRD